MLSGMNKLPTVPQKVFYRGRPETFTDVRNFYRGGREVVWAGITSCSRSFEAAAHNTHWDVGCVLELTFSNVYDISSVSFYPRKQEVLLAPNTKLVVLPLTNTQQLVDPTGTPRTVKVTSCFRPRTTSRWSPELHDHALCASLVTTRFARQPTYIHSPCTCVARSLLPRHGARRPADTVRQGHCTFPNN